MKNTILDFKLFLCNAVLLLGPEYHMVGCLALFVYIFCVCKHILLDNARLLSTYVLALHDEMILRS